MIGKNNNIEHIDIKTLSDSGKETLNKRIRGVVQTTIRNGENEIKDSTHNLVLLGGREFLCQKLGDVNSSIQSKELNIESIVKNFQIRYFGVGMGGATQTQFGTKIGPYENDQDLNIPVQINPINSSEDSYKYIHNGYMKRILSDGAIEVLNEDHTISVNGETVLLGANTTLKFRLEIQANEMIQKPFCFNEAVLYAVDIENDEPKGESSIFKYKADFITFAHFTTLNKYLEENDSLTIEWYILV